MRDKHKTKMRDKMRTFKKLSILASLCVLALGSEIFIGSKMYPSFATTTVPVSTSTSEIISQTLVLNKFNTSSEIPSNSYKFWQQSDFYSTPSRYTQFHYKYPLKTPSGHVILADYDAGGYIQNSQPIRSYKTFTLSISAKYWAHLEIRTSNTYSTDIFRYPVLQTCTLTGYNGDLKRNITFTSNDIYFVIYRQDGAEITINSLSVQYFCN